MRSASTASTLWGLTYCVQYYVMIWTLSSWYVIPITRASKTHTNLLTASKGQGQPGIWHFSEQWLGDQHHLFTGNILFTSFNIRKFSMTHSEFALSYKLTIILSPSDLKRNTTSYVIHIYCAGWIHSRISLVSVFHVIPWAGHAVAMKWERKIKCVFPEKF